MTARIGPREALAFAAVYVIWGSSFLATLYATDTLPPLLMSGVRFCLAGVVLLSLMLTRGEPLPDAAAWARGLLIGTLLLAAGSGTGAWAAQRLPSGLLAILWATVPLWMVLIEWVLKGPDRPGRRALFGAALGFAGLVVLSAPRALGGGSTEKLTIAAIVVAALGWGAGSVYSRRRPAKGSPWIATGLQLLCGGAVLLAVGAATGELEGLSLEAMSGRSVLSVLYLVVFSSLVAYSAYIWLLDRVGSSRAATYAYVNPLIALGLGVLLNGEEISAAEWLGTGIILAGVVLTLTEGVKARPEHGAPGIQVAEDSTPYGRPLRDGD